MAIFRCGGDGSKIVEIYHPSSDHWTKTYDLNVERWGSSGCSLGDKVYVFGGIHNWAESSVETF